MSDIGDLLDDLRDRVFARARASTTEIESTIYESELAGRKEIIDMVQSIQVGTQRLVDRLDELKGDMSRVLEQRNREVSVLIESKVGLRNQVRVLAQLVRDRETEIKVLVEQREREHRDMGELFGTREKP